MKKAVIALVVVAILLSGVILGYSYMNAWEGGDCYLINEKGEKVSDIHIEKNYLLYDGGFGGALVILSNRWPKASSRYNEAYAFVDNKGKIVIGPSTRKIEYHGKGIFSIEDELYDAQGRKLGKTERGIIGRFADNGLATLETGVVPSFVGYIDVNGNYVIEPKFYDGEMFASNGLAGVRDKNGLWGYIDETGEYVIEPKYEYAGVFADGLAPVRYKDGSWAYIRENGETAFDLSCEYANEFYEGHAVIKKDDRMQYFIDTNGNILSSDGDLDDYYNHVNNIGIERAKGENGLWGYVGTDGAWVILPCYEYAGDFDSVGRVAVVKDPEH